MTIKRREFVNGMTNGLIAGNLPGDQRAYGMVERSFNPAKAVTGR